MTHPLMIRLIVLLMMLIPARLATVTAQERDGERPPFAEHNGDDDFDEGDMGGDGDFGDDDDWDDDEIDIDEMRGFYKKQFPKIYPKINDLIKEWENEGDMTDTMERIIDTFSELSEIQEEEPELFKEYRAVSGFELESVFLGQEVRVLKKKAVAFKAVTAKTKVLKKILATLFEAKMILEKKEIERFKAEVKKMTQRLKRRVEKKDRIIQKRFNQLTGEEDDLEW